MKRFLLLSLLGLFSVFSLSAQEQWGGKQIGFPGDSMTDQNNMATKEHYWSYLAADLDITPCLYAKSGISGTISFRKQKRCWRQKETL